MAVQMLKQLRCLLRMHNVSRQVVSVLTKDGVTVTTGNRVNRVISTLSSSVNCSANQHITKHSGMQSICNKQRLFILNTNRTQLAFTSSKTATQKDSYDGIQEYKAFYKLDNIHLLQVFSNLKTYNVLASFILMPTSYFFISPSAGLFCLGVLVPTTVCLSAMSATISKIVGIISLDKNETKVKMSHLNFWGKRNDVYLDVEEVVPILDAPGQRPKYFMPFCTYTSDNVMYMYISESSIKNKENFRKVFGSLGSLR